MEKEKKEKKEKKTEFYRKIVRGISIDPEVWYAAKANIDNVSQLVEDLLRDWVDLKSDKKDGITELKIKLERLEMQSRQLQKELEEEKNKPQRTKVSTFQPYEL